jgi:Flp pilus assembly protein TadD
MTALFRVQVRAEPKFICCFYFGKKDNCISSLLWRICNIISAIISPEWRDNIRYPLIQQKKSPFMLSTLDQKKNEAGRAYECGVVAQASGRLGVAMEEWRRALLLDPQHEDACYNLAVALALTKDEKNAEKQYERLLALNPTHREALFNLANLQYRQERMAQAAVLYRRLVEAHPGYVSGWINLAKSCSDRGDIEEAETFLRRALQIDPQTILAHWNLSHLLLAGGRWAEAWEEYEWRLGLPHWLKPPVSAPAWNKESKARRILLWNDQGIGDAIQFLRYPRFLYGQGREVWVLVQDNLKSIAASAPGVAGALGPSDPLPEFDAQAPLLSLPHRLSLPKPMSSDEIPYLKAERVMELPRKEGRKSIGLVWAGNQQYKNDCRRSAPLSEIAPLFEISGIDWFSLQFGSAVEQIYQNNLSDRILDLSPRLNNFADTAAALAALDLVICIDTSVAHLAGAMNVPCWLMLQAFPEWRWRGQSATSEWYPRLRLFRQQRAGDWRGLASEIARELNLINQGLVRKSFP